MKLYIKITFNIILLASIAQNICMDDRYAGNPNATINGIRLDQPMTLTACDTATNIIQPADPLDDTVVQIAYKHAPTRIQRLIDELENYSEKTPPAKRQYLFTGKPGAGKTTLAQAAFQKADWSCVIVPIPEFCNEYRNSEAGALTTYINAILNQYTKCGIVLDEMTLLTDSHNKEQHDGDAKAATTLWWLLDKCNKRKDIVVIGTTNDDSKIPDPLRSRFNNKGIVTIAMPSLEVRYDLLNHLFTNIGLSLDEAYLNKIAKKTNGKSFRDIIDFSEQAADHAVDNKHDITQDDIDAIIATWRSWYHPCELYNTYGASISNGIIKSLPITIPAITAIAGLAFTVWQFKKQQQVTAHQMKVSAEQSQRSHEQAATQLKIAMEQNKRSEEQAEEHRSNQRWTFWTQIGSTIVHVVSFGLNHKQEIIDRTKEFASLFSK